MGIISATKLVKKYGNLTVLNIESITIEENKVTSIVGPSGAGKSTLLHILGSLLKCDNGEIFIENQDISKLKDDDLSDLRNKKLGFVFQNHNLLPEFTAIENICLPAMIANVNKKERVKKAEELLSIMGIRERKTHFPSELSGGEQQRVSIARALINSPKIIFADEPTGNLDSKNADSIHDLFFELNKKLNQTFLIVTHNTELSDMAHNKITLRDGGLVD